MIRFDGRTVIVTGAGNGLGRAHALEFARRGAHVVVNDLGTATDGNGATTAAADHVVEEILSLGGSAVASYDSVASDDGCRAIAARALEQEGRVDAVVHNAGILRNAPFSGMTDERFFPVLETHLLGAFYLTRAVYPAMVDQQYGRLVFTSSGTGAFGRQDGANYSSAKAALLGLCNTLAIEGAEHGILANAILPVGYTRLAGGPDATDTSNEAAAARTQIASQNARMLPEWVSPMVVYLASEDCTRTRHYYSAALGRFARVFIAATSGWYAPGDEPPLVEDIDTHLPDIESLAEFDLPDTVYDELARVVARFGSG